MLKELAPNYFLTRDHNCSESTLLSISEAYSLGLTAEDAKLVSGFGAGMGCGKLCGVLSGCMAACGKMAVRDRAHATEGFGDLCAALYQQFDVEMGGTQCEQLKPVYRTDAVRCLAAVERGLDLFERFVETHDLAGKKEEIE